MRGFRFHLFGAGQRVMIDERGPARGGVVGVGGRRRDGWVGGKRGGQVRHNRTSIRTAGARVARMRCRRCAAGTAVHGARARRKQRRPQAPAGCSSPTRAAVRHRHSMAWHGRRWTHAWSPPLRDPPAVQRLVCMLAQLSLSPVAHPLTKRSVPTMDATPTPRPMESTSISRCSLSAKYR